MDSIFLKSDIDNTKVYSLKSKSFDNSGFSEPFVIGEGPDTCVVSPELGTLDFQVDDFCEKPVYVPELTDEEKKCAMYYPFGDKLEGYNLYDILHKEYIKAKGNWSTTDENDYYEIRNKGFRKKNFSQEDDGISLEDFYVKNNSTPQVRNSSVTRVSYNNAYYGPLSEYGEKINFTFDGVMPGTGQANENLLLNCFDETEFSENSIYQTPTKVLESSTGVFNNYSFSQMFSENYTGDLTFSFFSRLDDTIYVNDNENVNERRNPGGFCQVNIEVNNTLIDSVSFLLESNWKRHMKTFSVTDMSSIKFTFTSFNVVDSHKIKLCGFMLNKGDYAINYDHRYHFKTNPEFRVRSFPILIRFLSEFDSENYYVPSEGSWTIAYKRFISSRNKNQDTIDVLGNNFIQLGYRNNLPYFKVDYLEVTGTEAVSDLIWEHVVVSYDSAKNTIVNKIYSDDKVLFDTKIDLNSTPDIGVVIRIGSNTYLFNLLLGSYLDSGLVKVNNYCKYKDLIILPKALSDKEMNDLSQSLMAIDTDGVSYYERTDNQDITTYELRTGLVSLRSSSLIETNNIGV